MSTPPPSKTIVCLHGSGSTENIFKLQLAKIRLALKNDFEFLFIRGPFPAPAGPGILPAFAEAGPFYAWFEGPEAGSTIDERLATINDTVQKAVQDWERTKQNPDSEIVGVLGFSAGALAAVLLLWQQQVGRLTWLPKIRFATFLCCFFPDEVGAYMPASDDRQGEDSYLIKTPTLHVHGLQDFCLARARKLLSDHYQSEYARVIEFNGGHQIPNKPDDCAKIVQQMKDLASETGSE